MADFNTAGQTALTQQVVKVAWMAWLDIVGDVQRVTTAPYPMTFSGTGDADLDGLTFGQTSALIDISEVTHRAGGADTVTAYLSALPTIDTTTLNQIGDKTNWLGRTARLWMVILNPDTDALISVAPYYQGYMMQPRISGSSQTQTIALDIEGFLASMSNPSGRTYLDAKDIDSGDTSAEATLSAANGSTPGGGRDLSLAGLFGGMIEKGLVRADMR